MCRWGALTLGLCAVVIRAAEDTATSIRESNEASAARGSESPVLAAWPKTALALWPDARWDARVEARRARSTDQPERLDSILEDAVPADPRSWRLHRYAAERARARGNETEWIEANRRSIACHPFHAQLHAVVGRELLQLGAQRDEAELAMDGALALTTAAHHEAIGWWEIYDLLVEVTAPDAWALGVAGDDFEALHRLIEHAAARGEQSLAIAAGQRLDRDVEHREGEARAWVRLAVAARKAGETETAVACFERAAQLARAPESFALDHADALLEAGSIEAGAALLAQVIRAQTLSPDRIEGSLRCAASYEVARLALEQQLDEPEGRAP